MSGKDVRIVIVGAGAAGLSAAHHLYKNGFQNIVILEATDRIGGRIHTVPFGDKSGIIEMGANWIHGVGEENSMFTLAKSKEVITEPYIFLERKDKWLTEGGTYIDEKIVDMAWDLFEDVEEQLDNGIVTDQKLSVQEFADMRLAEEIQKIANTKQSLFKKVFYGLVNDFGLYEGDDLCKVSANLYHIGDEISDDDLGMPQGYAFLLQTLANELPKECFFFNKCVTNICWRDLEKQKIRITFKDENGTKTYLADHVIVTCPLGHLKQNYETMFSPSLPQFKVDAIKRMGFGKVGKIFLYYERPFWEKGNGRFFLARDDSDHSWSKSIVSFTEVANCPNVLLTWVHGEGVTDMENSTEKQIKDICSLLLRKFLDKDIPYPSKVCRSSWCNNPLFLGAYCYFANHSQARDVLDIASPLLVDGKPVVCFAGEATHPKWLSYTHGARSSGIRESRRVEKFYCK